MLATACSRLLSAGELVNQMRNLQRNTADERYWQTANALAEQLAVAGHCLTESHRILLGQMGVNAPGGLIH